MRALISLIVIIYLVGVGVALSPTIQAKWNSASASDLATSVGQALPNAIAAGESLPQHSRPWLMTSVVLAEQSLSGGFDSLLAGACLSADIGGRTRRS